MHAYQMLVQRVYQNGMERPDRTGVGTRALFGQSICLENSLRSFPAITTKKLGFEQVCAELECFLGGYENLDEYHDAGCRIWDKNAQAKYWKPRKPGDVGRTYGVQWLRWRGIGKDHFPKDVNQLRKLIDGLQEDPFGRRHIVTAWQPAELDQMCLPPCHIFFQCLIDGLKTLHLQVYMRSVDLFIGLPFDIASYAILQRLICQDTGYKSGTLTFFFGDAHIYNNHLEQVFELLSRDPKPAPILSLDPEASIFNFKKGMAQLSGYFPHPFIKAEMNE